MAFVLDKVEDMNSIYEACKQVYTRELSVNQAVVQLSTKIAASEASVKMYFNIYACMRKGKVYKMGTGEAFTKYLLTRIWQDDGIDALTAALRAVKSNSAYRESVNNAQPGLRRACEAMIAENNLPIDYDSISLNPADLSTAVSVKVNKEISKADYAQLQSSINLPNVEFAKAIMSVLEKYQTLSNSDLDFLTSREKCTTLFRSSYPLLYKIDSSRSVEDQIKDATGKNRYYSTTYKFNNRTYVMTSQLYGLGTSPSTRDNRTPFYNWVLEKFCTPVAEWWPSLEEYNPGISKDQWLDLLRRSDIFTTDRLIMMAQFYALGGQASCALMADTYGNTSDYYRMACGVHLAERVAKETGCPICNQNNAKFWPVLFVGRDAASDERGSYVWKLRNELLEALEEFGIEKYLTSQNTSSPIGRFDSWEIVDEVIAIKHCDKSFFEHNGSGVPKGICWFFDAENLNLGETRQITLLHNGKQYQGRVANESSDRRRVRIFWNAELGKLFAAYNSPGATATFKRILNDTYEITIKGGEAEMTVKEEVAAIKAYIAARGFNYEGDLIENFYLSLKSKPFVILAGTSGTGKTRLVKLFAEAIGAKMKLVPVRPDWSDASDLFGYTDLSNHFHPGVIIEFIKQAEWDKDTPYFICLDEMNLARVEYYLSDFLSIIETRDRRENGKIETDTLIDTPYYKDPEAEKKFGRVYIPENLYIIGTVNMDETTFPFSKKVLDRANTIEFSFVNLMSRVATGGDPVAQKLSNDFLKTDYLYLRDCDDTELIDTVCFNLEELNHILVKANLHVGYRVRDEICFYMMTNKAADLLSEEAALDHEIMQKILPRVQGSSAAIKEVLSELFIKCAGDYSGFAGTAAYEQMNSYLDSKPCRYPNSAKKITFMMRRYEEDGFTSYWL